MSELEPDITPEFFFDDVVPHIFNATRLIREQARVTGTCEIQLFGAERSSWTLNLGTGTVEKNKGGDSDLFLEMNREDFVAMLADELDVSAALMQGRIRLQGDVPLLTSLSTILRPRSMPY